LLEAATAEFAEHGIAGARVDRIAAAARSNKAQIYHYFGSKDGLFDAVFGAYATQAAQAEYFDARDLPGTAGRLFDQLSGRPDLARLATWYRLERTGSPRSIAPIIEANAAKVSAIRDAQTAGVVTNAFPPDVLLGLVITLAMAWVALPPEFAGDQDTHPEDVRRGFVTDAVARLVAPR
jgi:AcrR family transcriptional regulator